MATKKKAAKSTKKASGDAEILKSVHQSGTMYNPGDEAKLASKGFSDEVMQNMTDRGLISGFGYEPKTAEPEPEAEE